MTRLSAVLALLAAVAPLPLPLAAQDGRPNGGKIDEVERNARNADDDDDDGGGGWWGFDIAGDIFKGIFLHPKAPGQGYLPYPYAAPGARETFVLQDVQEGRRFNSLGLAYFGDASTSLRATMLSYEGANDAFRYTLAWSRYVEPKPNETDELDDVRFGLGIAAPAGRAGYVPVELAARGICLDTGDCAGGVDFHVGVRLFPARPLGLSASFRIGGMEWDGGGSFLLTETNAGASVFAGRLEVAAGWHWLKLGPATAFAGPTLTTRLWF